MDRRLRRKLGVRDILEDVGDIWEVQDCAVDLPPEIEEALTFVHERAEKTMKLPVVFVHPKSGKEKFLLFTESDVLLMKEYGSEIELMAFQDTLLKLIRYR